MHEVSNIKKANPANFEMTVPVISQGTLDTIFNLLVNYELGTNTLNTFDLYIKLPNDIYKLETCVITNGTFIIEKLENLKLTIAGEATKLTRGTTLLDGVSLPSRGTRDYQLIKDLVVSIDNVNLSTTIYKCSVELQNDIEWIPYETVNKALSVTNAATSMYPSNFTLKKRILSGSVGQYVTDASNSDVQSWKTGVDIEIKAGNGLSSTDFRGFHLKPTNCTFTNRNTVEEVFSQSYDWKMNDSPADLGTKIKLNTLIT